MPSETGLKLGVLSRSFSANEALRERLSARIDDVRFNESGQSLNGEALVEFLADRDAAIVALERIDGALLDRLPGLAIISKYGVGLDNVDLEACQARGVKVGWTGGVNRRSVSELAVSLMIMALRRVQPAGREILAGTFRQHLGRQLGSQTVGLVGCGHVGRDLAGLLRAFGARVIGHDIRDVPAFAEGLVERATFDELLATADIVSLHVPMTPATAGMIAAEEMARMKSGAILINTARGGLVDEAAMKRALVEGHLSAAAFDVFDPEPPTDRALLELPNFISTPHIGGSSAEAVLAMGEAAIEGLFDARDAESHIPDYLARESAA
ncbi:phosphoglycerate dehydrogenase [Parasphingopyxis marina]|uniref:Phosphoglycerate dehydrogenase n=1 Tax=Parasphingopyxis marina TaxID=2761622 RepID=A0A842HVR4_9SPHN|nr:phosphoglycerate dehydrogenase [Parasphingopyxis marina]MBC2776040.1 phosphoglycerate dehydrogenase [Parasphingopyxis marina]